MCVVSAIGDNMRDGWPHRFPHTFPNILPNTPWPYDLNKPLVVSRDEFDALKREVAELKILLQAAKRFDENTNQRECETEEKMELLRKVAKAVGLELDI